MAIFNTYTPNATTILPADILLFWQTLQGANKNIDFQTFAAAVNASALTGPRLLASQYTAVVVANTAASTSLLTGNYRGDLQITANSLVAGSVFKFRVQGFLSTKSGGYNQTLQTRVKIGGITINADNSTALTAGQTSVGFILQGVGVVRTTGVSGTITTQATFTVGNTTYFLNSANATTAVDTTVDNAIDVSAIWSLADSGNSITATSATFELI